MPLQTANFGQVPNEAMPNSFLAHAYDLGDPWTSNSCQQWQCCSPNYNKTTCDAKTGGNPDKCGEACIALTNTSFYMGPIHPRIKKVVGNRLAQSAMSVVYGSAKPGSGPTISGCSVDKATQSITVQFNQSLLQKGSVAVKNYDHTYNNTAMYVLWDSQYWCGNTTLTDKISDKFGVWYVD